jgi:hypothetical protein
MPILACFAQNSKDCTDGIDTCHEYRALLLVAGHSFIDVEADDFSMFF